ncbi:unnamed protein product [Vitrella brassicaformis CCMP3155]|uniref:Integrase catalytic domain-containing protein n=1 Tax=Vitrella brassicaformis (strain CCMP3155) TaxID=1169540 RepID=A0A0G4EA26_VITBC|nr:unnamed protein product [Vitrella brassicaformis CCMP3155]|eukprot:CEL92057.1 unnamed protein product [Vitrella brassicaformis CCMP3155]
MSRLSTTGRSSTHDTGFDFENDRLELPEVADGDNAVRWLGGGSREAVIDSGASLHVVPDEECLIQGSKRPTPGLRIKTAKEGQDLDVDCRGEALLIARDKNGTNLLIKRSPVFVAKQCPVTLISERQLHTRGGGVHKVAGQLSVAYIYWHVEGIDGLRQARVIPLKCVASGYRLTVRPWTEADDERSRTMEPTLAVGKAMQTSLPMLLSSDGHAHEGSVCSSASSDADNDSDGGSVDEADGKSDKQLPEIVMTDANTRRMIDIYDLHTSAGHIGVSRLPALSQTIRGCKPITKIPWKPSYPPCHQGKAQRVPIRHRTGHKDERAKKPAEKWHADWAHMRGHVGAFRSIAVLALVFVCAFSGFVLSYPANTKTEVANLMRHHDRQTQPLQRHHGKTAAICIDPGSELAEPNAPFGQVL